MRGHLIAIEGLDQSGKQTQAERLRDRLTSLGHRVRLVSFPDYTTHIGDELSKALAGDREYSADVMQLLYVANRYEWRTTIQSTAENGDGGDTDELIAAVQKAGRALPCHRPGLVLHPRAGSCS